MNKPFDPMKPVQTRDGRKARILATGIQGTEYSIVAVVEQSPGDEEVRTYTPEGLFMKRFDSGQEVEDLVNVPEKIVVEGWVNVYPPNSDVRLRIWPERSLADVYALAGRIACVKISQEVIEGDRL